MALDVDGKVALITGGSNGIGEGVARHLAGRGARVVIADIDVARGKAVADEIEGRFIRTDVTDPAASTAAVALAVEAFGGLHIAHLNAGVTSWCGMGDDFDPEAYRRSMAINLDGVVYGIAAARPRHHRPAAAGRSWPPRPWPAWWSLPSTPSMRPTSTPSSAWSARLARSTSPTASASTRCARRSPTPTSSRAPSRRCSTWGSRSSTWPTSWRPSSASSMPSRRASAGTSSPGRESEPFEFRRAPGPRLD